MSIENNVQVAMSKVESILKDYVDEPSTNVWENHEIDLEFVTSIFDDLVMDGVVPQGFRLHYTMLNSEYSYADMNTRVIVFYRGLDIVYVTYFNDLLGVKNDSYALLNKDGMEELLTAVFRYHQPNADTEKRVFSQMKVSATEKEAFDGYVAGNRVKVFIDTELFVPNVDSLYYTNYRGIEIARLLDAKGNYISFETTGEVRITHEEKDEYYHNELPEEVIQLIRDGENIENHGYALSNNNWFEVSAFTKVEEDGLHEYDVDLGVVDMPDSEKSMVNLLVECYKNYLIWKTKAA